MCFLKEEILSLVNFSSLNSSLATLVFYCYYIILTNDYKLKGLKYPFISSQSCSSEGSSAQGLTG